MTIEEIDEKGYVVKFIKCAQLSTRERYFVAVFEKGGKLYVAWRPAESTEYTTPFQMKVKVKGE